MHPNRGDFQPKPFRNTFSPFEDQEEYQTAKPSYHSTAESSKSKGPTSHHNTSSKPVNTQTSSFNVTSRHGPAGERKTNPHSHQAPQQLKSVAIQATFSDEDIFPPLDYRKCTRCGKNDAISPGLCLYKSRNVSHTDHSNMIKLQSKDKIAYSHTYKEDPHANDGDLIFFKQATDQNSVTGSRDQGNQTIVGIAEVRVMNRGPLQDFKYIEKVLLSPKD